MASKKTKVSVRLHDGGEYVTEIENFDAKALAEELNNSSRTNGAVAIGDMVVQRTNIARIVPVQDEK